MPGLRTRPGRSADHPALRRRRREVGSTEQYDVVACAACGAAYADTGVSQQQYDQLYTAGSRYYGRTAAHPSNRDLARFREVAAVIHDAVRRLSSPDRRYRLCEWAAAAGIERARIRSLFGIDPSPRCVQEAEKTPGVRGFVGSLSEMPKAVSPYNVVVLSHVLEHVRDVHPALENLKVQMRTGSLLYVEVPDAARYADYAWSPFQDFNTEHINHFSAISLGNVLRRAGFRVHIVVSKDLLTAPGMPYPAIYSLSTFDEYSTTELQPDVDLRRSLDRYVKNSQELLDAIDERLSKVVSSGEPVLVWGPGS